jgi:hypothetical protein
MFPPVLPFRESEVEGFEDSTTKKQRKREEDMVEDRCAEDEG